MNQNNSSNLKSWSSTTLPNSATDVTSGPIRLRDAVGYAIFLKWTGAVEGTFKLQGSCDKDDTVTNWKDLGVSQVATGISDHMFHITDAYYSWVRVVYTGTAAAAGVLTVSNVSTKGF